MKKKVCCFGKFKLPIDKWKKVLLRIYYLELIFVVVNVAQALKKEGRDTLEYLGQKHKT